MSDKIISKINLPIDIDILELIDIKKYILNLFSIIEKQSEQIAFLIEENALLKEELNQKIDKMIEQAEKDKST